MYFHKNYFIFFLQEPLEYINCFSKGIYVVFKLLNNISHCYQPPSMGQTNQASSGTSSTIRDFDLSLFDKWKWRRALIDNSSQPSVFSKWLFHVNVRSVITICVVIMTMFMEPIQFTHNISKLMDQSMKLLGMWARVKINVKCPLVSITPPWWYLVKLMTV